MSQGLNSSEKSKTKVGQQQHQTSSFHPVNHSLRSPPTKSNISRTSSIGKLQLLKPARVMNSVSCATNDSLSPSSGSKITNNPLTVVPLAGTAAPLRSPVNNPILASAECKPTATVLPLALEKRSASQAQSRNDFFNLVRKKSMANSSSAVSDSVSPVSASVQDKPAEAADPLTPQSRESPPVDRSDGAHLSEGSGEMTRSSDAYDGHLNSRGNGENSSSSDAFLYSEEEEAAFLRSLGWDESAGEDEGLTEEEISAFYRNASKVKACLKNLII